MAALYLILYFIRKLKQLIIYNNHFPILLFFIIFYIFNLLKNLKLLSEKKYRKNSLPYTIIGVKNFF